MRKSRISSTHRPPPYELRKHSPRRAGEIGSLGQEVFRSFEVRVAPQEVTSRRHPRTFSGVLERLKVTGLACSTALSCSHCAGWAARLPRGSKSSSTIAFSRGCKSAIEYFDSLAPSCASRAASPRSTSRKRHSRLLAIEDGRRTGADLADALRRSRGSSSGFRRGLGALWGTRACSRSFGSRGLGGVRTFKPRQHRPSPIAPYPGSRGHLRVAFLREPRERDSSITPRGVSARSACDHTVTRQSAIVLQN